MTDIAEVVQDVEVLKNDQLSYGGGQGPFHAGGGAVAALGSMVNGTPLRYVVVPMIYVHDAAVAVRNYFTRSR
jgi:hypothetical protein